MCNNYCFSTATMAARRRLNVTLYVRTLPELLDTYPPDNNSAADIRGDLWYKVTPTPKFCFVKAFSGIT